MFDIEVDFVSYGNALEPLDTENLPRKKPLTIGDQFAYDTQGRRRFHGAFTGGFSAGYFNTVGTKDGWEPQQFKSTRVKKAENVVQCPTNFMDEEDLGEFGIAPTIIRTTEQYNTQIYKSTKRERYKQEINRPIPGTPVLSELLKPIRDNVGVILLKKMGWKHGQGIGPRLTKREKKQKIYNTKISASQQNIVCGSDSECSDNEFVSIRFAPDDTEVFRCNPKENYFGIGFSGLDRRPILTEQQNQFELSAFTVQEKNKKISIRGQAFGVGAFELEDDDIYAKEDMTRYDFMLAPLKILINGRLQRKEEKTGCVEGFMCSNKQQIVNKLFEAPNLPKNFQTIYELKNNRFSLIVPKSQKTSRRYRSILNAFIN